MTDIIVRAESISKSFVRIPQHHTLLRMLRSYLGHQSFHDTHAALLDLSFEIKSGEKIAVIGGNGAGKTTLLRILSGILEVSSGHLEIKTLPASLFKFWIGFNHDLTVCESMRLLSAIHRIPPEVCEEKIGNILERTELWEFQDAPTKTLSSGQWQRLTVSVFFESTNDFLIFDESLTHLDSAFLKTCERHLEDISASSKTIIMTSHDAEFLRRYCDRAIWLDHGKIRGMGEIDEVVAEYERAAVPG